MYLHGHLFLCHHVDVGRSCPPGFQPGRWWIFSKEAVDGINDLFHVLVITTSQLQPQACPGVIGADQVHEGVGMMGFRLIGNQGLGDAICCCRNGKVIGITLKELAVDCLHDIGNRITFADQGIIFEDFL